LVNAFEKPVWPWNGKSIMELSIEALEKEAENLNTIWKMDENEMCRVKMPAKNVNDFIKELSKYAI
jgi:hypothetical protein